jgi:hypothetical protein
MVKSPPQASVKRDVETLAQNRTSLPASPHFVQPVSTFDRELTSDFNASTRHSRHPIACASGWDCVSLSQSPSISSIVLARRFERRTATRPTLSIDLRGFLALLTTTWTPAFRATRYTRNVKYTIRDGRDNNLTVFRYDLRPSLHGRILPTAHHSLIATPPDTRYLRAGPIQNIHKQACVFYSRYYTTHEQAASWSH